MIQIYVSKNNFDTQKAQRFFKERRVQVQLMDLKKHKLGQRELELFARCAGGVGNLLDREDKKVKESAVAYNSIESYIMEELLAHPTYLKSPICRNGQKVTIGLAPEVWETWV